MPRATPPKSPPRPPDTPTIPEVIDPSSSAAYLEVITRAVFQAGVTWAQIAQHWNAYRQAFEGFDPARVALYDDLDVDRVLATPGILRMRRKVSATIANARVLLEIERTHGSFGAYLSSYSDYETLAKDVRKRFTFLGEMNVWYVLFRTGHPVPRFEQWVTTIQGEHPRMREMVALARARGTSREIDPGDEG